MSSPLKPPDSNSIPSLSVDEAESFRQFSRTPRPYFHDGLEVHQHDHGDPDESRTGDGNVLGNHTGHQEVEDNQWHGRSGHASVAASESGTEADDERPGFVKALPPASLKPHKGLKTGEKSEYTLLTPSQLDDEGRHLSQDYFKKPVQESTVYEEDKKAKQEYIQRRRFAEFIRRSSEVGLMAAVVVCVLCGRGVGKSAWQWKRELLSHVIIMGTLILAYPVKLSIVDTRASHNKLWERFRVPASFDPATVLYPPLLPVLVALTVSPANEAVVLPNIILGLSSLPQRLFPRSSRLGGINAVHWFISVIPLIVARTTFWPVKDSANDIHRQGLSPETLVSLYPLHHALLLPLYYLTTTSLLISELHLLSVALINLLLLAASPQIVILKACIWIGGVVLFVFCGPVLYWSVTLARVPRWKLRRPGHTAEERKSLVDAVQELIGLQRVAAAFKGSRDGDGADSDADEDQPTISLKGIAKQVPRLSTSGLSKSKLNAISWGPYSAIEPPASMNGAPSDVVQFNPRPRRNTLPERDASTPLFRDLSSRRKPQATRVLWCLQLTPEQADRRKWAFSAYVYLAIFIIIFGPVRQYVMQKALHGQEPVGWAISYLFGQIPFLRSSVSAIGLSEWVPLPTPASAWREIVISLPLDVNEVRTILGLANVRLILIGFWAIVLLAGLLAVFSLTAFVEVDTRRKVFHGIMVAMMFPSVFIDPCYCALALALVLAVFLLLEAIRIGQVPPLGNAIGRFVAPYIDGRDLRGPVVVSHIFLLIGCAVPLWFSLASVHRTGGQPWIDWELVENKREIGTIAGVVCVGMGDAAASLIGRRYGRHKWIWVGGKSLEGSAAFVAAVTAGLTAAKAWQVLGSWNDTAQAMDAHHGHQGHLRLVWAWALTLVKAVFCACGASFMEAVLTGANDNVVVPVALWLLVKGARL